MRATFDLLLTLAANLVIPLLLVAWTAVHRSGSRLEAGLVATSGVAYLLLLWRAGPIWAWVGSYWPAVFAVLYGAAVVPLLLRTRHAAWWPPPRARAWLSVAVLALAAGALAFQVVSALRARTFPGTAVDLAFPLRGGMFTVVQGGSSRVVNHHYRVPAQRYALDIVALNRHGLRADGVRPAAPEQYAIFDAPVCAPCEGEVVAVRDGIPDDLGPASDPGLAAGNHVTIVCHGRTVLLAHLKASSISVGAGDRVQEGQVVGHAGSSGNSQEPHLHIHAVEGRVTDHRALVTSATAVPMRFAGRFLVRNDHVTR